MGVKSASLYSNLIEFSEKHAQSLLPTIASHFSQHMLGIESDILIANDFY